MKKIIGLIVLITLIGTGFVFAHGKESGEPHKKQPNYKNSKEKKHNMMKAPGSAIIEIKEISGEIVVKDNDRHIIKSGKDEIKIILSSDAIQALKLNTGSKISIKGIELPAFKQNKTDEKIIKVFELQYDGRKFLVLGKGANRDKPKKGNKAA
ncbi:MAG: hypothetical protein FWF38_02510 [Spirochaetaceae bacterium]|nr:hypothetical protein [Spirochaetaceae bacterium]